MHRTNLKGMNFGSSASKTHKPCIIGSLVIVTWNHFKLQSNDCAVLPTIPASCIQFLWVFVHIFFRVVKEILFNFTCFRSKELDFVDFIAYLGPQMLKRSHQSQRRKEERRFDTKFCLKHFTPTRHDQRCCYMH